jgi:AraC-like DNA-binding protein
VSAARYGEFPAPPGSGLACLWTLELPGSAGGPFVQPVVPDGCVDLIWWGREAEVTVAGPDTGPSPARLVPGDLLVGVRFGPGTAPPALGVPADAVRDGRLPLRDLWGGDADRLGEAMAASRDRQATLVRAVLSRTRSEAPDPLVPALVRGLASRTVREVADEVGLGERQLRRRSIAAFGYGPKTVQRVLRFQRALRLARAGRPLAEVAYETGYADQAHMANEVRGLAGTSIRGLL